MFEMKDLEELAELCETLDEFKTTVKEMCLKVKVKGNRDRKTEIYYDAVCEKLWQHKHSDV